MPPAPCRASALLGLLLSLLADTASAQTRRDAQRVPVILTLSGGVSLGSYEAGVNWGLVEVFKQTQRDSLPTAWNLPRYHLSAATGASAGNINAFLAAIEWCRSTRPTPPDSSLFWKIWVRTGFDQLFPLARYSQKDTTRALFSRRYFHRVLFDTIAAAMRALPASAPPGACGIPIGVSITRVAPETIPISSGIRALPQRYAATVTLPRRGGSLFFPAPDVAPRDNRHLRAPRLPPAR